MKWLLGLVLVLAFASTASATWQTVWVEKTENVQVYIPGVYHMCDHGSFHQVPGVWVTEQRPYWVRETHWEFDLLRREVHPQYLYPLNEAYRYYPH